jgi:hypothetical protein
MKVVLCRIVFTLLALLPTAVQAENITFWFASEHPYPVGLEFSSADEPDRYWPGDGMSYPLDDYEEHSFVLNCRTGERICWGAWEKEGTVRWGAGYKMDRHCEDCCYECVGQEVGLITLQPE